MIGYTCSDRPAPLCEGGRINKPLIAVVIIELIVIVAAIYIIQVGAGYYALRGATAADINFGVQLMTAGGLMLASLVTIELFTAIYFRCFKAQPPLQAPASTAETLQ